AAGVFAALRLGDAADRGGGRVPRLAGDGQAAAGTRREEGRGSGEGASGAGRPDGARRAGGRGMKGGTNMDGELESLMRDVGRVVEGDARRRNILPQVQAALAARELRRTSPARALARWTFAVGGMAACAAAAWLFLNPAVVSYAVSGAGEG